MKKIQFLVFATLFFSDKDNKSNFAVAVISSVQSHVAHSFWWLCSKNLFNSYMLKCLYCSYCRSWYIFILVYSCWNLYATARSTAHNFHSNTFIRTRLHSILVQYNHTYTKWHSSGYTFTVAVIHIRFLAHKETSSFGVADCTHFIIHSIQRGCKIINWTNYCIW